MGYAEVEHPIDGVDREIGVLENCEQREVYGKRGNQECLGSESALEAAYRIPHTVIENYRGEQQWDVAGVPPPVEEQRDRGKPGGRQRSAEPCEQKKYGQ